MSLFLYRGAYDFSLITKSHSCFGWKSSYAIGHLLCLF
jgi:hypothetical protein